MEKEQFLVKLRKLVELGRSKQNALDVAEINDFFTGDNLVRSRWMKFTVIWNTAILMWFR